ncbi:HCL399Cp [Eremothecium sinecaudum]|uniref:HCL399Cp n=1 Tax=Eremothecium sinecaudum TaxID=45286 RepID=A0A109UYP2_9SACH|nr:HCL399Cp [Eremothecium sinecaudum]AMD19752.1 HCL399Cp [Eremothecium sinecaudum]
MSEAGGSDDREGSNSVNGSNGSDELYQCPVCNEDIKGLASLNMHLDVAHGFNDEQSNSKANNAPKRVKQARYGSSKNVDRPDGKVRPLINQSHWQPIQPWKSTCFACKKVLNANNGMMNCAKCGEVFCKRDCGFLVMLNKNATYDPINGEWFACCRECMEDRKGYNDYGQATDLSRTYVEMRNAKNEDTELRVLQLEARLIRLVDGIVDINKKHEDSTFSSIRVNRELSTFERAVTPWRTDETSSKCSMCERYFNLLLRKHHCRLCGRLVCDNAFTNCSNDIPIHKIANSALHLPIKDLESAKKVNTTLKVCTDCIRYVFAKRSFQNDKVSKELPPLLSKFNELDTISRIITRILPRFKQLLTTVNIKNQNPEKNDIEELTKLRRRLLETFMVYEKLAKQLFHTKPTNAAEQKIHASIQAKATIFIQENMLPLKNVPQVLAPPPPYVESEDKKGQLLFNNLTIPEVKSYREQLMVLKEQKFIVEGLVLAATKQRKFDEIITLKQNIAELETQINDIENKLGDEGFN